MLIDRIIIPEKQKMRCVDEILQQAEGFKTKNAKKNAVKKILPDFYEALIKLPFPFQIPEAARLMDIIKDKSGKASGFESLLKTKQEKKYFKYISDISVMEPDYKKESEEIFERYKQAADEIKKILTELDKENLDKLYEKVGGINMLRFESYMN